MKSVTFGQLWAIAVVALMSCLGQTQAQEYYKWVDARGVTTYSATPPPAQKQEPQLDPAKKNVNMPVLSQTSSNTNPVPAKEQKTTVPVTATTALKTTSSTSTNTKPNLSPKDITITVNRCDGVRCWDVQGKSYNLVAGTTYLSANGGKCQKTGNSMYCSK